MKTSVARLFKGEAVKGAPKKVPDPDIITSPSGEGGPLQVFGISPLMIFPHTMGRFSVYLKVKDHYVLYTRAGQTFTQEHRQRLYDSGVDTVYVLSEHKAHYQRYLEQNLGRVLNDERIPLPERSKVFYDLSLSVIRQTYEDRLPSSLKDGHYRRIVRLVEQGIMFLAKQGSLKNLASLISHDYYTYSHSVHVFVFTIALLQGFKMDKGMLLQCGIGAMLHDIGKTQIPRHILNKPGKLNETERQLVQTHPLKGVALCARVPLGQDALNIILFHHERMDGSGYPAGLENQQLPLAVKAAGLADVYDALTTKRAYAEAVTPFQALSIIREDMEGQFDPEVYRHFVLMLSGAELI